MTTDRLDTLLAATDPGRGVVARRDPELLLREILFDEPGTSAPARSGRRPRRTGARVAMVAVAAAALVTVPVLVGNDSAYAGWTAYPTALSTGQRSAVAGQCQRWVQESITSAPTRVVLSERRGDIGLALLTGPAGLLVTCEQLLGGSGEPSGGSSETYLPRVPLPDQVLSDGGSGFSEDDGEPIFRVVSGRVGADVDGVTVHTEEQGDVIATVAGGYFTAWWPGPPEEPDHRAGGLPMEFTFTAHLRDGTSKDYTRDQTR